MPEFSNALVWFRRDLRTRDQTALYHALEAAQQVHCVFVFDRTILDGLPPHDARVAFIHDSLAELQASLQRHGGGLWIGDGDPVSLVPALARHLRVDAVFLNHDYEPAARARDAQVANRLNDDDIVLRTFKDQAIFEKNEIVTGAGKPYSVYTPYKRAWLQAAQGDRAFAARPSERHLDRLAAPPARSPSLPDVKGTLHPRQLPSLKALGFGAAQSPLPAGEDAALTLLEQFESRVGDYHRTRDFPALASTSLLSTHLRHGTVSARALARTAYAASHAARDREGAETWLSELVWRDFFFQILYHHPRLVIDDTDDELDEDSAKKTHTTPLRIPKPARHAFKPDYDLIAWESGKQADAHFAAWCEARTGYPLVDAAMRQINQTGFMHNRLRMVAATFLIKDLGIDWRRGEAYFERLLNDFDLSANNGNWQWASSSGCDAQPYFRIFNPLTQSEKFDANGAFIREWVPELAALDDKSIHAPWLAKPEILARAGITLGKEYPHPLVDHAEARQRTLERYGVVKQPGTHET
ncbi:deoxyribodipyrimidine photo-lyase [Robbsia andropogonis]|uniref:cryptochrome/photolyase family protein n=1 Tax=Robbsia andropogonis TaxID=28092 RepID=UPI0020A000DB|nr:deoxyribodipyrimidine photo-lyase [Robbsia andropogonis]MCP1116597.1 DNA photolyase family protein [Robbsia andropogonis]MCP1126724.1 DNA photolyase family protein [Robbsia andropogonis]